MASGPSLVDLLRHPVRWRITQALIGRSMTTGELRDALPEIPSTSLYRQVGALAEAGVLEVVDERRVRGAVERTYALHTGAGDGDPADADGLRAMFTVFTAGLAADLDRYLERPDIDPARDGVSFRQAALLLTDDELRALAERLGEAIAPFLDNAPAPGRTRRVLSTLLIPDTRPDPAPPADASGKPPSGRPAS
ncbi:helix-turn-helix domain-containing protein [Pseudonocardia humida]|uniref:Helix-turn-helix domain-containing protein n=1 Tax=Pseudonocardia humida TaxID=2800819 RepID=A0ABT1AAW8_9PSEU|nr:helix-turn-helix domain-containing protein [Pseudonocardia humida]MCO1660190.1 helix-turn-helix domain-containing protein [Pseudonocardia humida]